MAPSNKENTAFKNWINPDSAELLASAIHSAHPTFDRSTFLRLALGDLGKLELKARVKQFSRALASTLPTRIPDAIGILVSSLPPPLPDCEQLSSGWHLWPIAQFIEDHGTSHPEESMAALTEITQRFTGEFAVRPFIIADPGHTLGELRKLTTHPNPHVRRWCSEGSRPRLPWGMRIPSLIADPTPLLPILDSLREDPEPYVRRSVANNLNDIAKDHPDLVVETCRRWYGENHSPETARLIRHALRTLIKDGHPPTLAFLGYNPPVGITANLTLPTTSIRIGETLPLQLTLSSSTSPRELLIDFAVHYHRPGGKTSRKVFKWKTLTLPAHSNLTLLKKHPFRPTSIRALHPGRHTVEILLNGQSVCRRIFQLS